MTPTTLDPARVAGWRTAWDEMMTAFVPGLATLERATATTIEALLGGAPRRVLDLGGGPGLFAGRMAARWPDARITLVDIDPVLLELARAALPTTVTVTAADLTTPAWPSSTGDRYDLITAVMTVHYLDPGPIRALYAAALQALAPGGLLIVADLMPDDTLPTVMASLDPAPAEAAAELAWAQWWSSLDEAPHLHPLLATRADLFRTRPPAGFTAPASWHTTAARQAGFRESGLLWRDGRHAALAARR
ncbi:class I SAM-dependent methyltransferase [Actinoplanes sp. NPDC051851]|uniref:class I SAM-dependent methyltransferase n=1 Tax=Actinoplanes sp. NPDC051851 TaxID=3154753 RepID=UPI003433045D